MIGIDCADFDIAINYCPMCGKELRKEKNKIIYLEG